jgi:hypothetical protein
MYPANSHVIRPATLLDAPALRSMARAAGQTPLTGRILVAEVGGAVAAAISRDQQRTLRDPATAPGYLTSLLRMRVAGVDAFAREPDLSARLLEAVLGPREDHRLPLAA